MRHYILTILVVIVVTALIFYHFNNKFSYKRKRSAIHSIAKTDSLSRKLESTIDSFNAIKPLVQQTIDKIKYYEGLKKQYQVQIDTIYRLRVDSFTIKSLQAKLLAANNEITRLKGELVKLTNKPQPSKPIVIETEKPNDNAIVINLDGGGVMVPKNLSIYIIPYNKITKRYMIYEASCDATVTSYRAASYYNGVYFLNDIAPGKYIVKICTYYGNYKVIKKDEGKLVFSMSVSPPLQ